MINIAIIGAGQIGSRHLQALGLMDQELMIQLVDLSADSMKTALSRFEEVKKINPNSRAQIECFDQIAALKPNIDVAIIATHASIRKDVIVDLLDRKKVKYLILEKILFQKEEDYRAIESLLAKKDVKTWVNCPRRLWPFYQNIRVKLLGAKNTDFLVTGSNICIGSNAIHFLDLFSFIIGDNDLEISTSMLKKEVVPGRLKGSIEFIGTLSGRSKHNNRFAITEYKPGVPIVVQINNDNIRAIINEDQGYAMVSQVENKWELEKKDFQAIYQSQLTNLIVQQLMIKGDCNLTSYAESMRQHLLLIRSFNNHLSDIYKKEVSLCPIT